MNHNRPPQIDILDAALWAIGARPAYRPGARPKDLVDFLLAHRVIDRFVRRQQMEGVVFGAELEEELQRGLKISRFYIERNERWVRFLDDILSDYKGQMPLLLKGNSASVALGQPELLRPTGDVDLIASDGAHLHAFLLQRGFTSGIDHMPHEFPPLAGAEPWFEVDLHRYFPVWSAKPAADPSSFANVRLDLIATKLSFHDLATYTVDNPLSPGGRLRSPAVTESAVLIACHMYHDFVERRPNYRKARVRLIEVAEFWDLLNADSFDGHRAEELVEKVGAERAWEFAVATAENTYRSSAVATQIERPMQIWWGTGWSAYVETVADLYLPLDGVSAICEKYSALFIDLSLDLPQGINTADPRLTQFRQHSSNDQARNIAITWTRSQKRVRLVFQFLGSPSPFLEELLLMFPNFTLVASWEVSRDAFRIDDAPGNVTAEWMRAGNTTTCVLEVDDVVFGNQPVPVIVSSTSFSGPVVGDWNDFYKSGVTTCSLLVRFALDGL